MKLTIEKLLKREDGKELTVLAGSRNVNNVISNTNIMDNPESFDWIMPGDLVITTGFFFKDSPSLQKQTLKKLSESNCAALAVKPRKYFGTMPEALIEAANEYHVPLLEIPAHYSLSQVSNSINRMLVKEQDSIIQKTLYIHEKLTDITLSGGGVQEIADEMAKVINNPLIVVQANWQLLAFSEHKNNPYPIKDYISIDKDHHIFSEEFREAIPYDAKSFKKSIKRKLPVQSDEDIICRIVPIKAVEEIMGYIVVWETVSKMTKLDYIAIEKAAMTMALEIIKNREVNDVKNRIRHNFFDDLLSNNFDDREEMENLAALYGMNNAYHYVCIVIQIKGFADHPFDSNEEVIRKKRKLTYATQTILKESQKIEKTNTINAVHVERGRQFIIFYPLKRSQTVKEASQLTRQFALELYERVNEKIEEAHLSIGIGGTPYPLVNLNKSYQEAQGTMALTSRLKEGQPISHYTDYLIYELMTGKDNKEKLMKYYDYTVRALDQYDEENKTDMIYTLETYFESLGNIELASKKLYIHRNTLVYRLNKIMSILNVDFKDALEMFELQVGLLVRKIIHTFE